MSSTDLTDFRNQFLARAKANLLAVDLSTANNTTLIMNAALLRGYDSVNKFDAIGPDAIYPITLMTGAELDTYLSDPANAASFEAILASTEARTALVNSSTAMTAVIASATALSAVTASATAMTAVWASNTAADAVLTSSTARLAVYNDDTALSALQANPTQVARQIGIGGRCVSASTSASTFVFVPNGTKVILLRRYYGGTEQDMINWARGSVTAAVGQGPAGGGRNLDTGAQALGTQSGVYTSNGAMPTANNDTANFVSAANGLQRRTWSNGNVLYVIYITV